MGLLTFHPEILTKTQEHVFRRTAPILDRRGFRLAGGTALALTLGHRRSDDFDWFTRDPLNDGLALAASLRQEGIEFTTESVDRGTLHGRVEGVRVTCLEFRYPDLDTAVEWPDYDCSLVSLDDIACMKLSAIAQRGARKDFIDLHALVTRHRPLAELLPLYQRKFDIEDLAHLLFALVYFDDALSEPIPEMLWPLDWQTLESELREWVRGLAG